MRKIRWSIAGPVLLLGVGLFTAAIIRTMRNPGFGLQSWIYVGLPMLVVGLIILWVLAQLRGAKSARLWQQLSEQNPDAPRFLVMVHSGTRRSLEELGWKLHGTAFASTPVIGIVFGEQETTFWEGDHASPTLVIPSTRLGEVRLASVPDAIREHSGVAIRVLGPANGRELLLDLRDSDHRPVDVDRKRELIRRLNPHSNHMGG